MSRRIGTVPPSAAIQAIMASERPPDPPLERDQETVGRKRCSGITNEDPVSQSDGLNKRPQASPFPVSLCRQIKSRRGNESLNRFGKLGDH